MYILNIYLRTFGTWINIYHVYICAMRWRQAVIHFRCGIRHNADNGNNHGNDRHINQMAHDQDQQSVPSQVQFAGDNNGSQANRNNTGTSVTGSRGNAGSAFNGNRGN
jgi:hypothetical protein